MARPLRIELAGAVYHVMSRGNNRGKVFLDEGDHRRFLDLLGRCAEGFGVEVFAFCLMSNHYHLFVRTPQGNLSRAMHWLTGTYTQGFNRRHRWEGHLFRGRYKAVVVDDESHWLHLSAYIHLNPVRAGLVADPAEYEWSSFRDFARARPRFAWLKREALLAAWGVGAAGRREYARQVRALVGAEAPLWESIREAVFFGERERWETLQAEHGGAARPGEYESWGAEVRGPVDAEAETGRVAEAFGAAADDVRGGRRRSIRPAAYYHLVRRCGLTRTRVAEIFGVSVAAVSLGMKGYEDRLARDKDLRIIDEGLNLKLKL